LPVCGERKPLTLVPAGHPFRGAGGRLDEAPAGVGVSVVIVVVDGGGADQMTHRMRRL
jgi:hypothetical protein